MSDNERGPTDAVEQVLEAPTSANVVRSGPTLSCLPERTRIAQLLLPLAYQSELLSGALPIATAGELGAIGLLGFPDERIAEDLATLQQASFVPVMVASDEEGGTVQRLSKVLGPMPAAATSVTLNSPDEVLVQWREYGARAKAIGIDVIFAPVVDVGAAPGIASRSFSDDPAVVTAYGGAMADGLFEGGITPVFKHFPGHGRASGDSHLGLPVVPTLDELWATDLVPYADLVGNGARPNAGVMIGHLSVPGFTGDLPTSLSPDVINGLLKEQIGFDGLVFTDALNMGAIIDGYGTLEAVELSIRAGADVVILGSLADHGPALDYLVAKANEDVGFAALLDDRVVRVLAAKGQTGICAGAQ